MKKYVKNKKSIRVIETTKNFSGEASPYWEYMQKRQRSDNDGTLQEDILGNPDMLDAENALYPPRDNSLKVDSIKMYIDQLSKRQKEVLSLYAIEGLTLQEVACRLNITLSTVQVYLKRGIKAVIEKYNKNCF